MLTGVAFSLKATPPGTQWLCTHTCAHAHTITISKSFGNQSGSVDGKWVSLFPLPWRWSQAIPSSFFLNYFFFFSPPPPPPQVVKPCWLWALNNVAMLLKCIRNLQNTIYLHHQIVTVLEESVIPPFAKDTPGSIVPATYLRHHRLVLRLWAHHMHLQHQLGQTTYCHLIAFQLVNLLFHQQKSDVARDVWKKVTICLMWGTPSGCPP